ncbi:hypothetical protein SBADM41S_05504 [Streptomyces badius]
MKRMISPSAFCTSSMTFFNRSSNWPRYWAPATMPDRSRETTRLSLRVSGTSPATMLWARPSTMAVLPTPGSPMRTGLFLERRERISMVCSISSALPTTGSSFPAFASSVRSRPNSSRVVAGCLAPPEAPSDPAARSAAPRSLPTSRSSDPRNRPAPESASSMSAPRMCSGPM